jgi:hypothetical protein
MKNLTLINNEWKERVNPNITTQEQAIINNPNISIEDRKITMEAIQARTFVNSNANDQAQAQTIYDANKITEAELISVDVSLPSGCGIINCRVGNEHKQIRF